jgi:putative copper export protein
VADPWWYAWVPKALVFGLVQLGIGIAVARQLASGPARMSAGWDTWFVRLARRVAWLLAAALVARLWMQTASAFGPTEAFGLDNLRVIALESRWGESWRAQLFATAAMVATATAISAWRFGWVTFGISALGVALTMPLLGHAAGSWTGYVVHTAHGLGAGAWVGTLGVVALAAWSSPGHDRHADAVAGIVERFSPVALTAAALVAGSGSVATWLYMDSWTSLGATTYGRVLLLKLCLVGGVAACGWRNWRDVRNARRPARAVVTIEYLLALLVIALTGLLTETEHP